jgi:hypothetical protein
MVEIREVEGIRRKLLKALPTLEMKDNTEEPLVAAAWGKFSLAETLTLEDVLLCSLLIINLNGRRA